ncbi:Protein NLP2 [Linum grandiflorum]
MDHDGGGAFTPNSTFGNLISSSTMDLDPFMDQIFDERCWMGTPPDGFSFLSQPCPPTSLIIPELQHHGPNSHQDINFQGGSHHVSYIGGGYESRQVLPPSIKDRLEYAIRKLKEYTEPRDVLVQIWVPITKGGKHVLTTEDQPYFITPKCLNLASYRNVSKAYLFGADLDSQELVGLPGRVFLGKLPEWTPDVRYFKAEEYPRRSYAAQYSISGSLAFPVFERGNGTCLGVVEVITTTRDIQYRPELENVCKALEAVDLSSSEDFIPPSVKGCKEFFQAAVPELSEILASVCKTHRLPLALAWAPCFQQGKGGCRHFDESYARYISTVDSACLVEDAELYPFHAACSEQYLLLGQGLVGKAFTTKKQCFSSNVSTLSKAAYPLSHHAMVFGLQAAIAIPLQTSTGDGTTGFVLELFLPKDCQDPAEQSKLRDMLPVTVQQASRSLRVIMEQELEEGRSFPVHEEPSWISQFMEVQQKSDDTFSFSRECPKEEPQEEFKVTWENNRREVNHTLVSTEHPSSSIRRMSEKRRTKTEKTVSLDVLRQYFAGSLKDAAKSLGVCPTTLKRICRQYGINRWPSRKIKKVGHTLKKLQLVIDSVQGADGAIQIGSFYTTFPDLTSPNHSGNVHQQRQVHAPPELNTNTSKSTSTSSSQSSGCSSCYSDGAELKRTRSDAELLVLNHDDEAKPLLARSQSHRLLLGGGSGFHKPGCRKLRDGSDFRVKASFRADRVRFSLPSSWGFKEFKQEVMNKFNVDESGACRVDLKYLDDDQEWVLLTCDDDLEECKDVYRSEQRHTIKLSLHMKPGAVQQMN